jgi:DNA-directed RNA polymerase specialized sigma24 family protein
VQLAAPDADLEVIALADALDELSAIAPRAGQVVELRFFGGFSVAETADALDVSVRTVMNDWNTARAWLRRRLTAEGSDEL